MKSTREVMKQIALEQMTILGIREDARKAFETEGRLYYSENGILHEPEATMEALVQEWGKKEAHLPYHIIRDQTGLGEILTILHVSCYKDDWETEEEDLRRNKSLYAYAMNLDIPVYSELGFTILKTSEDGAVSRTM